MDNKNKGKKINTVPRNIMNIKWQQIITNKEHDQNVKKGGQITSEIKDYLGTFK